MNSKSLIHEAIQRGANLIEEEYFKDLTEQLYEIFGCDYAYIGVLNKDDNSIQTIAIRKHGKLTENFSYDLEDVPCEVVNRLEEIQHFENVMSLFPSDQKLRKWKAQSYVGVPIMSPTSGDILGIMVLIKQSKFSLSRDSEYLLTILSLRAGAELERQKSTRQLKVRDEQLENITRNSPDIIFECRQFEDGSVKYTYVSKAVNDILEVTQEEAMQRNELMSRLMHPDDRKEFKFFQSAVAWKQNEIQWIGRVLTEKTRKEKWLKIIARSEGVKGDSKVWYGVMDDITIEKNQEKALQEAKLKAEKAASAKEDFLANMSHEIRTPLNAIYGITELLLEEEVTQGLDYLNSLKFSVENLRALINNILDFSKLSAGNISLNSRKMDLHLLLHNLIRTHSYMADRKNIHLDLTKDETLPKRVVADELVLFQILNNLLGNAIKFTQEGEVILQVDVKEKRGNSVLLQFTVSDTGIGIDNEELERIFYKFEQAKTHYGSEGSGLGLTISRLLLELWDSSLYVESSRDKGSVFSFAIWMDMLEGVEKSAEVVPVSRKTSLRPVKILLVEDVAENRMLLIKRFEKEGAHLRIDEAEDGYKAIDLVKQNEYDLILMDMRMPGMSGYETMKEIRKMENKAKDLPIIALTADTYGVKKSQGWTDVVTKPFKFAEVLEIVSKYCGN